ncbi:hypothetical protein CJU90_3316 [Yarrowia sp. C11]|nr:hypothetical protein CKK34_4762 [Yarrowia sp. E02]KAG5369788.1 hypothetical protein CJU90_3316 [Yarrowia sp. C11]
MQSNDNSKSFLNLTTSTLFGVFGSQTNLSELNGEDSETVELGRLDAPEFAALRRDAQGPPKRRRSSFSYTKRAPPKRDSKPVKKQPKETPFSLGNSPVLKTALLFILGCGYGCVVHFLYEKQVGTRRDTDRLTLPMWGFHCVLLGLGLPMLDKYKPSTSKPTKGLQRIRAKSGSSSPNKKWGSLVRTVGAFLGVVYGVKNLNWHSTTEVGVIWALLNPFLWYLLDTTSNGFGLAAVSSLIGAAVMSVIGAIPVGLGEWAGLVWLASNLFCGAICFGNLGRIIDRK